MSGWSGIPIKPLARRAKRLREPFSVAPAGNTIPAARAVGLRTVADSASNGSGGITSPLTEQVYVGAVFYTLTSSDGLFVFEYPAYTDYIDAEGTELQIVHRDPAA